MPGLVLANLSSNWKKLQQTLQPSAAQISTTTSLKRKRETPSDGDHKSRTQVNGVKRVKKTAPQPEQLPRRKARMGAMYSAVSVAGDKSGTASTTSKEQAFTAETPTSKNEGTVARPQSSEDASATLVNQGLHPTNKPGKFLALDCEMVGSGPPPSTDNVLARVSIVNYHGEQIYDSYVQPVGNIQVTDYRTFVSGIRPEHLRPNVARPFALVQNEVAALLKGKVLVGHALKNDLDVLLLPHPKRDIRDTARHAEFRKLSMGKAPALRKLAKQVLGMDIQGGEHSSVEDARATMLLFRSDKDTFEKENAQRYGPAMKREQKMKAEESRRVKAREDAALDEEEDEDDEQDEEDEEDLGEVGSPGPQKKKKKNKKKKRTKRA